MTEKRDKKDLSSVLKYINYLEKGNKPRFPEEADKYLIQALLTIEKLSANKDVTKITITFETPKGNIEIDILEDSRFIFQYLYPLILTTRKIDLVDKYLKVTTQFLLSHNISLQLKTQIIDFENKNLKETLEDVFILSPEGFSALNARIELCSLALATPLNPVFGDEKPITIIFSTYISKVIVIFVNNGQLIQASNYLMELLGNSKSISAKKVLVRQLISHNTSFNLSSNAELNSLIDEYEDEYSEEDIQHLRSEVNVSPNSMHISSFSFASGNLSINSLKERNVVTSINFSIPNVCSLNAPHEIKISDNMVIIFSPVSAFWVDPMFNIMRDVKIASMGWSHFCDIEPTDGQNYTHVQIVIMNAYIPDVELTEDSNIDIDFSEKEALLGRKFYPHKEFVVSTMLDNLDSLSKYIEIDKKDININLFSNYYVQYIDNFSDEIIYRKIFAITNPDSYSKTTTRFIDRLNSINLSDSLIPVRVLLDSTNIESENNLMKFVERCIDLVVKQNIENHGGYKYLWKTDPEGILKPCREPEAQPYIFSHLRTIFDFMGIQISREVESSNGEIDFLLSFNNRKRQILRLSIELKLAHSPKIDNGLTKQLPAYMKGERCKYGIYLVLWYKGDSFDQPTKYTSISELQNRLDTINTNSRITSMIIDCSKPTSPSKLK